MSTTASTFTILGGMLVIAGLLYRALADRIADTNTRIGDLRADLHERLTSIDARVGRIEARFIGANVSTEDEGQ